MRADVVLPAAGNSVRMKMPVAKQFQEICGHPILVYTVDCFHRLPWIRHIVVVVDPSQVEHTQSIMEKYAFSRVQICVGGRTRHRSICRGVQALKDECEDGDVILIHDAARPFVPEDNIFKVASAAQSNSAAGVTRPLVSTVIRGDEGGRLVESLDRQIYRNSEMPQAFQYGVIAHAYSQCTEYDLDFGTECLLLALKYSGCAAHLVEGTDDLWKVTYQKDLYAMESIVKEKFTTLSIINTLVRDSVLPTQVEEKILKSPLKVAETEKTPANTFIAFIGVNRIASTSTHVESVALRVAEGCANQNAACRVGLKPFVLVIFTLQAECRGTRVEKGESRVGHDTKSQDAVCEGKATNNESRVRCDQSGQDIPELEEEVECRLNTEPRASNGDSINTQGEVNASPTQISQASSSHKKRISDPPPPFSSFSVQEISCPRPEKYLKLSDSSAGLQTNNGNTSNSDIADASLTERLKQGDECAQSSTDAMMSTALLKNHCPYRCTQTLTRLKTLLVRSLGKRCCTLIGILAEEGSPKLAEQLLDLVRQRATYLDGQLLDWT